MVVYFVPGINSSNLRYLIYMYAYQRCYGRSTKKPMEITRSHNFQVEQLELSKQVEQ